MPTTPVPSCPLCRSTARTVVYRDVRDRVGGISGRFSYISCRHCGVVYQDPRPTIPGDGYPAHYPQHSAAPAPRLQYGERASALRRFIRSAVLRAHGYEQFALPAWSRIFGALLHAIRPVRVAALQGHVLLPPSRRNGTLLDVGCGNGRFLGFSQLLGWRVIGIEPDSESAARARTLTGARIYPSIEAAGIEQRSLDVITMSHVLEHVPDPRALLAQCRPLLRDDGTLAVAVPNWRVLGRRLFGTWWAPLEPARHLVMFDVHRLRSLLAEADFTVVGTTNSFLRDASTYAQSWRLRFGKALPRLVETSLTIAFFVADAFVRRGGSEIVAWARPSHQLQKQVRGGEPDEGRGSPAGGRTNAE